MDLNKDFYVFKSQYIKQMTITKNKLNTSVKDYFKDQIQKPQMLFPEVTGKKEPQVHEVREKIGNWSITLLYGNKNYQIYPSIRHNDNGSFCPQVPSFSVNNLILN